MPHYRLYFLQPGNRVSKALDLYCQTDDEAIEKALNLRDVQMSVELWQGIRLVRRIEPPV